MVTIFPTDYASILKKMDAVNPVQYGKTRNFISGAVTYLSPYISRGVISTKQVLEMVLKKGYKIPQIESFVKELCWRDYFQRVGQHKNLDKEIRQQQVPVSNKKIPVSVINANTGIEGIDEAIKQLYLTGYMHNHCRMYTASLVSNIAKSHWLQPAKWMYYHLLDGDWASNACSWQWVAAANSNKKYYSNQENINKYCFTNQQNTYLDKSYAALEQIEIPQPLLETGDLELKTDLPENTAISIDAGVPTFIYNYYNLDPHWHKEAQGNRILLIEPGLFSKYPVSEKCMDFMLDLGKNIPDLQVYTGSFQSFKDRYSVQNIYYKEHPLNIGYKGNKESRDWITEHVTEYFPSFFGYWKKVEKQLYQSK